PGLAVIAWLPFRYPVKALIAGAASWAVLAGMGFERWLGAWEASDCRRGRWLGVALGVTALAAFGASWLLPSVLPSWLDARLGADTLRDAVAEAMLRLRTAAGLALAAGGLLLLRSRAASPPRWTTLLMAAVVLADLVPAGSGVNMVASSTLLSARPRVLAAVE